MHLRFLATVALGLLSGCSLLAPLPRESTTSERLAVFPTEGLPLQAPATVYWNDYLVPYISAGTERDAAFLIGLVHAHLRLAQMEFLRKVASARLSEMAGPFTRDIDHTLRIVDLSRAVAEIRKVLPPQTLSWVQAYVDGINHYKTNVQARSVDFVALNLDEEPWSVDDVIRFTRLAGVDVSWMVLAGYLGRQGNPGFEKFWPEFLAECGGKEASFAGSHPLQRFMGLARTGSNSLVLGGQRTRTGKPLIANDPHLGLPVPNLWVIAAVRYPGMEGVGLWFPGAPFIALGRNRHVAWGGTNMRALSSDLVDVTGMSPSRWKTRPESIGVRFWWDRDVEARDTPYGPLISDSPLLESSDRKWALKWVGHQVSDELTAFYRMNRATNAEEFRQAFETYAVGAQNFLYADTRGNIGQVLAARLPRRHGFPEGRFHATPEEVDRDWSAFWGPLELPSVQNPESGYLASANNLPVSGLPIGRFFSSDVRVRRLKELAESRNDWTLDGLRQLQLDVFSRPSLQMRDVLAEAIVDPEVRASEWGKAFLGWDGHYRASSRGPVAYQTLMYHLVGQVFEPEFGEEVVEFLRRDDCHIPLLRRRLSRSDSRPGQWLAAAVASAREDFSRYSNWGEMHRVRLSHVLGNAPLIGGRYRFVEYAAEGSATTLLKTSHSLARERHNATYGAQARHLSDLSDPDANHFVLLGGQDGWIQSQHMVDQVPLWLRGETLQVPLTEKAAAKSFTHVVSLKPAAGPKSGPEP